MSKIKIIKDIQGNELELIPAVPTETERGGMKAEVVEKTTNMAEVVVGKDEKAYAKLDKIISATNDAYIESTGEQYINTGIVPDENTTVIVDFEPTELKMQTFLGCDAGETRQNSFITSATSQGLLGIYNGKYTYTGDTVVKKRYRLTISYGEIPMAKVDDTTVSFAGTGNITEGTMQELYLFAKNRNDIPTGYASMKLYGFTVIKNDETVLNLIPALNNGTACLYDTIGGTYFYSGDSSEFLISTGKMLNTEISVETHWYGKKWYAYGTSLTNTDSLGKYPKYIDNLSGMVRVNKGIDGGGLVSNTLLKDVVMTTNDGKTGADLITLECMANDGNASMGTIFDTGDNTFCGALAQCIQYLQINTTAQIVVIISPRQKKSTSGTEMPPQYKDSKGLTYADKAELMRGVCELYNVPFINTNYAGLGYYRKTADYYVDHIHHTELGGKVYGEYIWSQLKDIPLWSK